MGQINILRETTVDDLCDQYINRIITEESLCKQLTALGFDADELSKWLKVLQDERRERDLENGQFGAGA